MENGKEENKQEAPSKVQFARTRKTSLQEFNREELIGWVIDRLNSVEEIIDDIIINHFKPEEKKIFKDVILNTSVLNFGAKVKVLRNIGVDKNLCEKLMRFLSIRNGFAHSRIANEFTLNITTIPGKPAVVKTVSHGSTIEVMNSAGKLVKKEAHEYVSEYLMKYYEVKAELSEFLVKTKEIP